MKEVIEKLTLKHRRPDVYNLLKELGCEYIGVEEVPIEKIMIDQGIYPREKTDKERVSLYASNILDGDVFPPILTGADYTKLDGNHRYYAHKEAEKPTIWIEKWEVPQGLYPVVAQAVNTEEKATDTPLTIGEKKRAILRDWELLNHYDKKKRKIIISKTLKVSIGYINKVLSQAGIIKSEKEELKKKAEELNKKGYSHQEIAEELGVPRRTISDWLNSSAKNYPGKNSPPEEKDQVEYAEPFDFGIEPVKPAELEEETEEYNPQVIAELDEILQANKPQKTNKQKEKRTKPSWETLQEIIAEIEVQFGRIYATWGIEKLREVVNELMAGFEEAEEAKKLNPKYNEE